MRQRIDGQSRKGDSSELVNVTGDGYGGWVACKVSQRVCQAVDEKGHFRSRFDA